eukprot:16430098-Heterocapsa_arctica.AAC.1
MQFQSSEVSNLSPTARAWKSETGICQKALASTRSIIAGGQGWRRLRKIRLGLGRATEVDLSLCVGGLVGWTWPSLTSRLCSGSLDTCQRVTDLIFQETTKQAQSSATDRMSSWKDWVKEA